MKAVILASGEDDGFLPITATRPKHLIKVGGKPILEHFIDALKKVGTTEALIVVYHLSNAIREHFGDGGQFDLKLNYVEQPPTLGTGNDTSMAQSYVDDKFILIKGDSLFSGDTLKCLIQTFETEQPNVAMAVVPVEKQENHEIVELENAQKIKRIVKNPAPGETPSDLADAGLYVFNEEIFKTIKSIKPSARGEIELAEAISLMIKDKKAIYATEIPKTDWVDVSQPWDLLEANSWALKRMEHKVLGAIEEGAHLIGPVTVAKTARIRSGAYVEGPSFIDEGADVGPNCYIRPSTSIGKNTRIGNACEVKNSIIMDKTHIGHLSYVGDSVICEHCNLAAGTIGANLRLDDGHVRMMVKNMVVDTGRRKLGAILGDNVKTGINALFMPGVKIGQNSWVGPNYMVKRDLEADTVAMLDEKEYKRKKNGDS